jgi:hypothetical protein
VKIGRFSCHKVEKTFPQPFPKSARLDTYAPHPMGTAPGLPSKETFGTEEESHANSVGLNDRPRDLAEGVQVLTRGGAAR